MPLNRDLEPWAADIAQGFNPFANNVRRSEQRVTGGAAASVRFNFKQGGKDQWGNFNSVYIAVGRNEEGQYFQKEDLVEMARWLFDEAVRLDRCQRTSAFLHDNHIGVMAPRVRAPRDEDEFDEPPVPLERRPEDEF